MPKENDIAIYSTLEINMPMPEPYRLHNTPCGSPKPSIHSRSAPESHNTLANIYGKVVGLILLQSIVNDAFASLSLSLSL